MPEVNEATDRDGHTALHEAYKGPMPTEKHIEALNAVASAVNGVQPEPDGRVKDSAGIECPSSLVGRYFLQGTRGTIYKVIGYNMHGDDDKWHVVYVNINSNISVIPYSRTVQNFTGRLDDGSKRFIEIRDTSSLVAATPRMP